MDVALWRQALSRQGLRIVVTTVDRLSLAKTTSVAIHTFLQYDDQYAREVQERPKQNSDATILSTDIAKPAQMRFCVSSEWFETVIDLGSIPIVDSYDDLNDDDLGTYFEWKAASSKDVMTIEMLDKIVKGSLRIYMTDKDTRSRIKDLFVL